MSKTLRTTDPEFNKRIGAKIRELRIAKGIAREDLALHVGVTHQQFSKYEKGINSISASTLTIIAGQLNTPITYLLQMEDAELDGNSRAAIDVARAIKKLPPERVQMLLQFKNMLLKDCI